MAIPFVGGFIWKLAAPFISAAVVAVLKGVLQQYGHEVPSWAKPILAALVGSVTVAVTGDPNAIGEEALTGFLIGGGAPMVREVKEKILPAPENKTADIGNG